MSGPPNLLRRLVAETIGTFCLVFAGTGAVVIDQVTGGVIGHGGVAAAFGLVVAIMIFAVGHLSGAHLNPAVTAGFAGGRHFPMREVGPYWAAQIAGALVASLSLRALFGTGPSWVGWRLFYLVSMCGSRPASAHWEAGWSASTGA